MYCHLHRGDWSFHLTNEKRKTFHSSASIESQTPLIFSTYRSPYFDCPCSCSCWLVAFLTSQQHASVHLTYLCPSLPVEHRPPTTPRHRTLFWAALVIPDQLVPCYFSFASMSRLQLLRGRPLFLFPCGFQVRAWRVVLDAGFLRVCPIQPHFLRQYLLGHWFLSRSLPQIFISDFLLPLDFVDAPQTGVEECLDLLLHRVCLCKVLLSTCTSAFVQHPQQH